MAVGTKDKPDRYKRLYDSAPVGFVTIDRAGVIEEINPAGMRLLKGVPGRLERPAFADLLADAERPKFLEFLSGDRSSAGVELELKVRRDGRPVFVDLTPVFPAVAADASFHGVLIDATARRLALSERQQAEERLKHTSEEAERVGRAKDDFLGALSHELRTPLSPALLLASESARNRDLPPHVRSDFDAIRRCIELEARLIDDLLDLERITRGKLAVEKGPADVHALLQEAVGSLSGEIGQKRIELTLRLKARKAALVCDAGRLRQVFWNIVKNAVKFTPVGGRIAVETAVQAGKLVVTVSDTGMGIDPGECETIFSAFMQGARPLGGLGLGLAISRAIVALHDGRIRVQSPGKDKGAVFSIELPLPKIARKSEASKPRPGAQPQKADQSRFFAPPHVHILLVEDHEPTRAALTQLLLHRRYKVASATSLTEARALVAEDKMRFDVLISDIGLPDGSGYDLMQELRGQLNLKGIALTGYGMEEDISRSHAAGFAAHLTKPVRIESLESALMSALKN